MRKIWGIYFFLGFLIAGLAVTAVYSEDAFDELSVNIKATTAKIQEKKAEVVCLKIAMGCEMYRADLGVYPGSLTNLTEKDEAVITKLLARAVNEDSAVSGYYYRYSRKVDSSNFSLYARPVDPKKKTFFIDNTRVIRLDNEKGEALPSPLE